LSHRLQSAAAALQHRTKEGALNWAQSRTAKTGGEQDQAGHEKAFPPERTGEPATDGEEMAFETRYEVRTHVLSSLLDPDPGHVGQCYIGNAGVSTSMNAAEQRHGNQPGIEFGRQTSGRAARRRTMHVHIRHYIHAWAKLAVLVLSRFQSNLDGILCTILT